MRGAVRSEPWIINVEISTSTDFTLPLGRSGLILYQVVSVIRLPVRYTRVSFRLFLVRLVLVLLFHLRCIHLHRSTSESFSSPDQIRHIFGAIAFHRTLIQSPSLKTAITFAYGLGIRKFFILRISTENFTSDSSLLCQVCRFHLCQIPLGRLSIRASKFLHAF